MASAETPSPATSPAPSSGTGGSDSSFGRIFGVLFSPKLTFEAIVRRPSWVVPVVLGCVFFIAVVAIFTQRGGWPSFFEKQAASNSRLQKLSAEDREVMINRQIKVAPIVAYIEGVIIPPVAALVVAGVLLLVFNLSVGTTIEFKTSLGIVAYAWVPWLIHAALSILILFLKDVSTVDLQNIVASNPGALLSDDAAKWLVALLSSIDIFAIWTMILLAIGFSATDSKKLSFGKSLVLVIIPWILFTVVKVGLVAAFS
jgi:Yip1 domain